MHLGKSSGYWRFCDLVFDMFCLSVCGIIFWALFSITSVIGQF